MESGKRNVQDTNHSMTQQQQANSPKGCFAAGSLKEKIAATVDDALQTGALEPIQTDSTSCVDRNIEFLVRIVSSLRSKPPGRDDHNPFLPYEDALHVADATSTHACILNKYNVVDHHLLIVTRAFEHQETLLSRADFQALWRCLLESPSLGFYNSGAAAGASQRHKHLQLVPLPLFVPSAASQTTLPSLFDAARVPPGKIQRTGILPVAHAFTRWEVGEHEPADALAARAWTCYRQMLQELDIRLPRSPHALIEIPYNLLVTRRWMLLVPRASECYREVSLNALAFAGALLTSNTGQLKQLQRAGPFAALKAVGRS